MKHFYLISLLLFIGSVASAQDCSDSDVRGTVDVPLVHAFSQEQRDNWPRATEIQSKLANRYKGESTKVFYELAEPYDPKKESLILVGGFYPWQNLPLVSKGSFSYLKKEFNVLEIHFRGGGCSSTPAGLDPLVYTHEMIASDIEAVRQKLGISKFNGWASSNGSYVMLMYAVFFPENVDKVLLRDTSIYVPTELKSSQNFEQNLLPEFLGPKKTQGLLFIKQKDPAIYKKLMKYFGTIFFRRAEARQIVLDVLDIVTQSLIIGDNQAITDLFQKLDLKLNDVLPWNESVYANECLSSPDSNVDLLHIDDIFVIEYSPRRCVPYVQQHKTSVISDLDFRGRLDHLTNPFFIYQGYWDEYLYKDLAIELAGELKNSQIYIDPNAGHGEISRTTFPCFAQILGGFLTNPTSTAYQTVCVAP